MSVCRAIRLSVIAVTVLLAGCTKGHFIELWNNTRADIVIHVDNENIAIKAGATGRFGWLEDQQPFDVQIGNAAKKTFAFEIPTPVQAFSVETTTKTLIRLQLNPDGFLYALPAGTKGFVQNVPAQPPSYPLGPKSVARDAQ